MTPELHARYLEFVRSRYDDSVIEISKVTPEGVDWREFSEGEFFKSFGVTIKWIGKQGKRAEYVEGSALAALWEEVMR